MRRLFILFAITMLYMHIVEVQPLKQVAVIKMRSQLQDNDSVVAGQPTPDAIVENKGRATLTTQRFD